MTEIIIATLFVIFFLIFATEPPAALANVALSLIFWCSKMKHVGKKQKLKFYLEKLII